MYEAHFGLSPRPFAETVDPSAFLALPSREASLRRLRYGLEQAQGPAMVSGPGGSGKTILAKSLASGLGGPTIHLTFPILPAGELIAHLAEELEAPPSASPGMSGSLRRLRLVLSAMTARGNRPTLIVDEAHLIEEASTFEALRLLLNFTSVGPPDLSILIVGGPELPLQIPASLADRLTARARLEPFTRDESAAYVLGRLARAGSRSPLFDDESLRSLHRASDGLPRRLNRIADLALLIAFAHDREQADVEAVRLAARESEADFNLLAA